MRRYFLYFFVVIAYFSYPELLRHKLLSVHFLLKKNSYRLINLKFFGLGTGEMLHKSKSNGYFKERLEFLA